MPFPFNITGLSENKLSFWCHLIDWKLFLAITIQLMCIPNHFLPRYDSLMTGIFHGSPQSQTFFPWLVSKKLRYIVSSVWQLISVKLTLPLYCAALPSVHSYTVLNFGQWSFKLLYNFSKHFNGMCIMFVVIWYANNGVFPDKAFITSVELVIRHHGVQSYLVGIPKCRLNLVLELTWIILGKVHYHNSFSFI